MDIFNEKTRLVNRDLPKDLEVQIDQTNSNWYNIRPDKWSNEVSHNIVTL